MTNSLDALAQGNEEFEDDEDDDDDEDTTDTEDLEDGERGGPFTFDVHTENFSRGYPRWRVGWEPHITSAEGGRCIEGG